MDDQGIQFPLRGLFTSTPYTAQPDGTAPVALNVRSFDVFSRRMRGGSRPGVVRYLDQDLGNEIQDINSIILPSAIALGISFDDVAILDVNFQLEDPAGLILADGTTNWIYVNGSGYSTPASYSRTTPEPTITSLTPDTGDYSGGDIITVTGTNMGDALADFEFGGANATNVIYNDGSTARVVAPSTTDPGSAVTVNVTVETVVGTSATSANTVYTYDDIAYVQSNIDSIGDVRTSEDTTFDSDVTSGNTLIVIVVAANGGDSTISDTVGTEYSLSASFETDIFDFVVYTGVAPSSGANTVSLVFTNQFGALVSAITVMEYKNIRAMSPLDDSSFSEEDTNVTSHPSPNVSISGSARLVLAVVNFGFDAGVLSGFTGYTQREYGAFSQNAVYEKLNVGVGSESTTGTTANNTPNQFVMIAFKPKGTQ